VEVARPVWRCGSGKRIGRKIDTAPWPDTDNNRRLHGANGMAPPVELESAYYALVNTPAEMLVS
jgi:hypothetical protein